MMRPSMSEEQRGTQPSTSERLVGLVRRILGPSAASRPIEIDARLSDLGVSSIKMVNLMLAVEMEFDLTIPQTEITPDNLNSIASVERLLHKLLHQPA
jgi:acyl carrier protein